MAEDEWGAPFREVFGGVFVMRRRQKGSKFASYDVCFEYICMCWIYSANGSKFVDYKYIPKLKCILKTVWSNYVVNDSHFL